MINEKMKNLKFSKNFLKEVEKVSFSSNAKIEVLKSEIPVNKCCVIAELSALFRTCGQLSLQNGKYSLEIITELPDLFGRVNALVKKLYENFNELGLTREEKTNSAIRYHIIFPVEISQKIIYDCYIMRPTGEFYNGIAQALVENECCKRSFIRGVFLGCASANIVIKDMKNLKKHTGGYHLEFVFSSSYLAGDFAHLLSEFSILAKVMQRKKFWVTYIKEAELVSDLLALVGANNAVMTLQNEFAVREVRNQLNRQLNCMNSNLEKMVDASLKQIEAIERIRDTVGLESLPPTLYELCLLRLANPEENYENLSKLMTTPLTKSGVNHRLRKIVSIAEKLDKDIQKEMTPNKALMENDNINSDEVKKKSDDNSTKDLKATKPE